MNIGIIGTGRMGSGIGKLWAGKGHKVLFGSRDPQKAKALAESIGANVSSGAYADAAKFGEAVLLAVNWADVEASIKAAGSLDGKILIDCTNPFTPDYMSLLVGFNSSGAEEIAKWAKGARIVKAFNHIYAQIIHSSPQFGSQNADVFICGDDAAAKEKTAALIKDIGFNPIDSGPLQMARYIEPMTQLVVRLAYVQGMGTDQALKLIRR
jgi:NADPH-dependent F420 reductase